MYFVVRQAEIRGDEVTRSRDIKVLNSREEAAKWAEECAFEELAYDGPYGDDA